MRHIDSTAWEEVLGVGRKELPWALQAQLRRVEDLHADVSRLRASLVDAPDEELVLMLSSASRSLAAAGHRIEETLSDSRESA